MVSLQTAAFPPLDLNELPAEPIDGLYVHIPFCAHKCHYCDFYSITRQSSQRMARFVDLILGEASMWSDACRMLRPKTIFIGGGTPTLLPLDQMDRLLRELARRIDFSLVDEFTVEANPATVDDDYCRMLRSRGVDRISFGGQTFDRGELRLLERHHDPDDVPRSVEIAQAAGFQRINVDLIYAIPGQDMSSWQRSLDAVLSLSLKHLSCYGLTYEPNTALAVRKRLGQFSAAAEPLEIEMFHAARLRAARAGLPWYEISNYASPGEECRHNLNYWNGGNYAALGPSGASHIGGWRFRNRPHLGEWESAVAGGMLPAIDIESLTPARRGGELIMLQLRLRAGVRIDQLWNRFGVDVESDYGPTLSRLVSLELIEIDSDGFRLTEKGLIVADAIAGEFLI